MKITFLGTSAAEGYPALFCNCSKCSRARNLGGRNIRHRSSALVNEDLLIDFGPDTSGQILRYNLNLTKVRNILLTHSHADHLSAYDFQYRFPNFQETGSIQTTNIWGNPTSIDAFLEHVKEGFLEVFEGAAGKFAPSKEEIEEELPDFLDLYLNRVEPHQKLEISEKYVVYTIAANHKKPEHSLNFLIQELGPDGDQGTTFLYGTDTAPWDDSEWDYLESLGVKLDLVALDCTTGPGGSGTHHSNEAFLESKSKFESKGLLAPDSVFYAHHFSHQSNFVYDDLVEYMEPHDVKVTYDGLVINR